MSQYFTMRNHVRWAYALAFTPLIICGSLTFAATPTSTNYAFPSSAVNNGVADMASTNFKLSSSLGDTVYTLRNTSTGFVLSPGFWHATIGLTQGCVLDVDGNGSISALTDGLMLLRAMLGLTGTAFTNGATASGASRTTWAQIQPFVHLAALDIDGSGSTLPARETLNKSTRSSAPRIGMKRETKSTAIAGYCEHFRRCGSPNSRMRCARGFVQRFPSANSRLTVAGTIESTSGGVKFPDSTLQTTAATKTAHQNLKVVAKSGGDFTTISAALAATTDNTATNRYLVYVAPGTYAEQVTMKPFVDIQGAGELVTKITFGGNISSNTGTVIGASNAELRFLTAENTGGNQYAVVIYNNAAAVRLTHVSANAFGGTQLSVGVLNDTSSPTIKDVTASATGSAINAGVYKQDSSLTINSSVIIATGGSPNWGIKNSQISAGAYTVLVNNSQIIGGTNTVNNDNFFTMRVGASQLSGGPVFTVVGTLTCAGVYDEAYVFSASTCP